MFKVSAPAKIILYGEHSVVHHKLALAGCLGLRTNLTFEDLPHDNGIVLSLPSIQLEYIIPFKDFKEFLDKPLPTTADGFNLHKPDLLDHQTHLRNVEAFFARLSDFKLLNDSQKNALISFLYLCVAMFGSADRLNLGPFKLSVTTNIVIGASMGSSAAFVVCLSGAFLYRIKTAQACPGDPIVRFEQQDLELASDWAFCAEKIMHGTPSGIDNSVCTFGSVIAFRRGTKPRATKFTRPLRLLLIDTRVPRSTATLVARVLRAKERFPRPIDRILDSMDEVAQAALDTLEKIEATEDDDVMRNCYDDLGELAEINHGLLRVLNVSHPSLEEIISILKGNNLKGKLTGGGGGGYAICFISPFLSDDVINKVQLELGAKGYTSVITGLGGDGLRVD